MFSLIRKNLKCFFSRTRNAADRIKAKIRARGGVFRWIREILREIIHASLTWSILLPLRVIAVLIALWCIGALYYCLPFSAGWNLGFALLFGIVYCSLWFLPRYWCGAVQLLFAAAVAAWFAGIRPDPAVSYQTNWAVMPEFSFHGNQVTIRNIRDFHYRSEQDFDVRYRTETFDPDRVKALSLAVSHWDGLQAIGHTMLSFEFTDGKFVAVSVETRIPVGKEQGTLPGMFKQFGLIMIFGTESDLIKLRASHRGETVYFYPTTATPDAARIAFLQLCRRAEKLRREPEFYNTLYRNCTTELIVALRPILFHLNFDWRMILNGMIDSFAAEKGYLDLPPPGEAYEESRNNHRVRAGIREDGDAYSRAIRSSETGSAAESAGGKTAE